MSINPLLVFFSAYAMHALLLRQMRLWIVGSFAVYAEEYRLAAQVYEALRAKPVRQAFGTMRLPSGEQIDWVDLRASREEQCR